MLYVSDGTIWPQEKTIDTIRYYTKYCDTIWPANATLLNEWQRHRHAVSDHAAVVLTNKGSCDQIC